VFVSFHETISWARTAVRRLFFLLFRPWLWPCFPLQQHRVQFKLGWYSIMFEVLQCFPTTGINFICHRSGKAFHCPSVAEADSSADHAADSIVPFICSYQPWLEYFQPGLLTKNSLWYVELVRRFFSIPFKRAESGPSVKGASVDGVFLAQPMPRAGCEAYCCKSLRIAAVRILATLAAADTHRPSSNSQLLLVKPLSLKHVNTPFPETPEVLKKGCTLY